ncbi:MAG TPA: hypothetical protein VM370_08595 [Candidatus Thermoplasmatota archaeon]|nr:hypothetical protein [Candidatus Thermoplasmatota archaeon]
MLRRAVWASAASGIAAAALFLALLLVRPAPTAIAWAAAYAIVLLAMLCVGGFTWIVLSLPPGAPWRRAGLRIGIALLGAALLMPIALGARAALPAPLVAGATALASAWRPDMRALGWAAIAAAAALALLGGGLLPAAAGAALAGTCWVLGKEP